jgi:hypothetical protein
MCQNDASLQLMLCIEEELSSAMTQHNMCDLLGKEGTILNRPWFGKIKQREHQFPENVASILWLDSQDSLNWNMSMTADQFRPVISWNEHLTSGAL